jgi:hypothetical protein
VLGSRLPWGILCVTRSTPRRPPHQRSCPAWRPVGAQARLKGSNGDLSTVGDPQLGDDLPHVIPAGGDARNEWDLRFNDAVPTDLHVEMGAGERNLDLDSLTLTGLDLQMGAGKTTVDLTGDFGQDLEASIQGGVGEATVLLPSEVGVRATAEGGLGKINAAGLQKEGEAYVNDAYGDSDVTLDVDIQGGVGQINLEVV